MRTWRAPVFYTVSRTLSFNELGSLAATGDYRLCAIWGRGSSVPLLRVPRRPGRDATWRQERRWESLGVHEVPLPIFEEYAAALELRPLLDTHNYIHMGWAPGAAGGLDARRYEECWRIRTRSGR